MGRNVLLTVEEGAPPGGGGVIRRLHESPPLGANDQWGSPERPPPQVENTHEACV